MNAPFNSVSAGQRDPFTAFVCDTETANAVKAVVPELGWPADKVNKGGLHNAVQTLSVSASPLILFVDLSEASDPINDINALAEVCEPGTVVIATGSVNDVRLYRDLVASGLQDYLVKPLDADALRETFMHAQMMLQAPKHQEQADGADVPRTSIGVIGTRGGVGASTVATSLAWLLSDSKKRSTALLDLDVQFGTGALAFDLEPGRGLTDALENPSRIDGLFIERAMVRVNERLSVLSAEAPITQPLMLDGSALYQLEEEMRGAFEAVVVDIPRSIAVQFPHLVSELQHVVIVTEQSLASTRDTIRLLGFLRANAPQSKVTLVVNKVPTSPPPEVARKDFEASIERKLDIVLPLDMKMAVAAAKQGKSLAAIARGGKLGQGYQQLLKMLTSSASDDDQVDSGDTSLLVKMKGLLPQKGSRAQAKR